MQWWAVDSDSTILARCVVRKGPRFLLQIVRPEEEPVAVSSHPGRSDLGEAAIAILIDCRKRFKRLTICPAAISLIDRQDIAIPEYILLGRPGEVPDGVMHTSDPVFIANYGFCGVAASSNRRHDLISFRSKVHLPPAGWEYWCTDARQEFERLSDEYLEKIQEKLANIC